MNRSAVKTLQAVPLMLGSFLLLGVGVTEVWAGFSDGLVGKGKASTAPSAGQQQENSSPPREIEQVPFDPAPQPKVAGGLSKSVAQGWFDVVGLRLGMAREEAISVLRGRKIELNGKPLTFEVLKERKYDSAVHGTELRTYFLTLSNAKSAVAAFDLSEEAMKASTALQDSKVQHFIAKGQYEAFMFQFPDVPNEPQISGITRVQRLAPPVHPDTIRTALVQKYGQPTIDGKMFFIWLTDERGQLTPPPKKGRPICQGPNPPVGEQISEFDYSPMAIKGCGEQLTVQFRGTSDGIMLVHTWLIHHQHFVDQREATAKAALGRLGLTPEQTKQAPAPQF